MRDSTLLSVGKILITKLVTKKEPKQGSLSRFRQKTKPGPITPLVSISAQHYFFILFTSFKNFLKSFPMG